MTGSNCGPPVVAPSASIPARLRRTVAVHLAANLRPGARRGTSLLLGIQGPSGDGKTFGVQQILRDADTRSFLISGGQLESGTAGEPAQILRDVYCQAGEYIANGRPAAVLLNDADAAVGSWGALTQYTVNTQNVITELMHLADYPTEVEGRRTPRAPIILTGNDFTRLYAPLCRPGRMRLCDWTLTTDERAEVVRHMTGLTPDFCSRLVGEFADRTIAFWAAAIDSLDLEALGVAVERTGLAEVLKAFTMGQELRDGSRPALGYPELREAASAITRVAPTDHLTKARHI